MANFSAVHRDPSTEYFEHQLRQSVPDHIGQFVDGEPLVYHELVSDHMHIDVFCWAPTAQRNMWTMATVGMAAHKMRTSPGHEYYQHAELVITLPADWPSLDKVQAMPRSKAHQYFWPIRAMKEVARLPYLHDTWVGSGHTTQAGRGRRDTFRGSHFSGMLVAPIHSMPEQAMTLEVEGSDIHLYGLYPLYAEELQFVLDQPYRGKTHELYHRFISAGLHEGIFPQRERLA